MPKYSYQCPNCLMEIEVVHTMNNEPAIICETCGGEYTMRRVYRIAPRWGRNPWDVLYEYMDQRFREAKARHRNKYGNKKRATRTEHSISTGRK